MADEETDEKTEAETPEAGAPEADATEADDAPREAADEAAEAPVPDEQAEDAGESPRDSAEEAVDVPVPDAGGESSEPVEAEHPKQRRKRERSVHSGEANPERSDEERAAEREVDRSRKAAERSRYRAKQKGQKGEPGTGTPPAEREPGTQRVMQGMVVSSKADKTITVKVESARRHPSYEKIVRRSKNLHAHDEANDAGEGDTVRVIETRPMSKTKRWRLVEIMERAR